MVTDSRVLSPARLLVADVYDPSVRAGDSHLSASLWAPVLELTSVAKLASVGGSCSSEKPRRGSVISVDAEFAQSVTVPLVEDGAVRTNSAGRAVISSKAAILKGK